MRQKVSWRLELGAAAMIVALCCFNPVVEAFVPRPSKKCPTLSSPSSRNLCSTSLLPTGTPISLPRCETRMRSSVVDSPSDVEPEINGNSVEEEDDYETPVLTARSSVGNSIKDDLMAIVGGGFLSSTSSKRSLVNELLIKLEALNPTPSPAYSPLLNGAWEFLYTGGISPGILGLQLASRLSSVASGVVDVGETVLIISRSQPRVEVQTNLKVFGRDNTIKIRTRLEPASDLRLDETYVEASAGNLKVPFPEQELFQRPLFISYLDEDLLVVRDTFGAPDILIRKDKDFLHPYTGVPSVTDDDLSPGAG